MGSENISQSNEDADVSSKRLIYIQVFYPGHIKVVPGLFFFIKHKNRKWAAKVRSIFNGLEIIDLNNWWNAQPLLKPPSIEGPLKIIRPIPELFERVVSMVPDGPEAQGLNESYLSLDDYAYTSIRARNFTELVFNIEVKESEFNPDYPTDNLVDELRQVLKRFIHTYRTHSRDISVVEPEHLAGAALVANIGFVIYDDLEKGLPFTLRLNRNREVRLKPFFSETNGFIERKTKKDGIEIYSSKMAYDFDNDIKSLESFDTYLKALHEYHVNRNYKYCFLDCTIGIESIVSKYLWDRKLDCEVSESKLKETQKGVDFSYKLGVELRCFLPEVTPEIDKVISLAESVNGIRNKVVHRGMDVDESLAQKALSTYQNLASIIERANAMIKAEVVRVNEGKDGGEKSESDDKKEGGNNLPL